MDNEDTKTSTLLSPVVGNLYTVAPCPVCSEQGGFHNEVCYSYSSVSEPFIGPGNSKAFMDFLRERLAREEAAAKATAKAKRIARQG
jgi:hypothetical protein